MNMNYSRDIWLNSITPFNSLTPCQVKLAKLEYIIYVRVYISIFQPRKNTRLITGVV
mgnify:CR=1 FL=1